MVIVQLLGGLGNQMFQYALGKHLALLNKSELKLDTSILLNWKPGKHAVNRGFDLDIFNLSPVFASRREIRKYHTDGFTLQEKLFFRIREKIFGNQIIKEKHFHFDASILDHRGDVYLSGTWQSYKYFKDIEAELRNDFHFRLPVSLKAQSVMQKIKQVNSVCLHVRRTDYLSVAASAKIMASLSMEYYTTALQVMKERAGNDMEIFIFSDDIEWCRDNFSFITHPVCFIDHQNAGNKISDHLQLMAACRHHILANSTFSWWSAWLNANPSKTVIAPRQWFSDESVNTNDLIPPAWIRI